MIRRFAAAMLLLMVAAGFAPQQQSSFTRNFKEFKGIVPGIDFFAADRRLLSPFEKPFQEAQSKMVEFLGKDLAPGAFVVCSTLSQKDAVTEARLLRMGYKWGLIQFTPDVQNQQRLEQIKARMGGMVPPQILERFQNQTPEARAAALTRMASGSVPRVCYAILMATLDAERQFRSSRLDDMTRSPLADWLDIGLVAYISGNMGNVRFLQDRIEDAFPLEDVLSMSRPFVAPADPSMGGSGGRGNGGGFGRGAIGGGQGGGMQGGTSQSRDRTGAGVRNPGGNTGGGVGAGGRGANLMNMPKDVMDRLFFDLQSSTFFAYLINKVGIEKCRELVQASRDGKELRDIIFSKEMLGTDIAAVESDWQAWIKTLKPADNEFMSSPGRSVRPGASR